MYVCVFGQKARSAGTRFSPRHQGLYLPTSKNWWFFVRVASPSCQLPARADEWVFLLIAIESFLLLPVPLLGHTIIFYTCVCPLPPSQLLGVFSPSVWSTVQTKFHLCVLIRCYSHWEFSLLSDPPLGYISLVQPHLRLQPFGISSSSACSSIGLYKSHPCEFSVGTSRHHVPPATMRRHCIGLAVKRLFTGRERLTLCSPFRSAACSLLTSGEGWKQKMTSNQTPTNALCTSTAVWQAASSLFGPVKGIQLGVEKRTAVETVESRSFRSNAQMDQQLSLPQNGQSEAWWIAQQRDQAKWGSPTRKCPLAICIPSVSKWHCQHPPTYSHKLHADDLAAWTSVEHTSTATHVVQESINRVSSWADEWCMEINCSKTQATLFSLFTVKEKVMLKLEDMPVPQVDDPIFLGVILDTRFT